MTFFDKFRKYAKDYVRERPAKEKGSYGQLVEVLSSTLAIKGLMTTKSVQNSAMQDGKSAVSYWSTEKVLYVGPEIDILSGDILVDGTIRYSCEHIETQDDFKTKGSHRVVYLKRIS